MPYIIKLKPKFNIFLFRYIFYLASGWFYTNFPLFFSQSQNSATWSLLMKHFTTMSNCGHSSVFDHSLVLFPTVILSKWTQNSYLQSSWQDQISIIYLSHIMSYLQCRIDLIHIYSQLTLLPCTLCLPLIMLFPLTFCFYLYCPITSKLFLLSAIHLSPNWHLWIITIYLKTKTNF